MPYKPDIMDLSRDAAADELDEKPRLPNCGCGGSPSRQAILVGQEFPYRVRCLACGIATGWNKLEAVADLIWSRAMHKSDNGLVDGGTKRRQTSPRKPRSSGSRQAAGKRATAPKGAQPKESSKS